MAKIDNKVRDTNGLILTGREDKIAAFRAKKIGYVSNFKSEIVLEPKETRKSVICQKKNRWNQINKNKKKELAKANNRISD